MLILVCLLLSEKRHPWKAGRSLVAAHCAEFRLSGDALAGFERLPSKRAKRKRFRDASPQLLPIGAGCLSPRYRRTAGHFAMLPLA